MASNVKKGSSPSIAISLADIMSVLCPECREKVKRLLAELIAEKLVGG